MAPILAFDEAKLVADLRGMPPVRRSVFAALVATRLAPSFEIYASGSGREGADTLHSALSYLWSFLGSGDIASNVVAVTQQQIEVVMGLIPSEDDYPAPFAAQAEDAAAALAYALRSVNDPNPQEAAWAARRAYESADNLVISRPGVRIGGWDEGRILQNKLIQVELQQQRADIESAATLPLEPAALERAKGERLAWGRQFYAQ